MREQLLQKHVLILAATAGEEITYATAGNVRRFS